MLEEGPVHARGLRPVDGRSVETVVSPHCAHERNRCPVERQVHGGARRLREREAALRVPVPRAR